MEFVSDADNLLELTNLMGYVAERDAFLVFKACDGIGTNDELLIKTLCSRTKKQINGISHYYKHLSGGQGLRSTIASECGGDYGEFMTFLCRDRKNFLNNRLQRALRGTLGCNKKLINELFCFSSTEDIQMMKEGFEGKKDKSLADKLRSKLMGEHESLIIYLLLNGRAEGPADESAAEEQAAELHKIFKNGAGMMGFKESAKREVGEFLAKHSADQMEAIKSAWDRAGFKGKSLEKTITDVLGGDLEDACLCLITHPLDAICGKLKEALSAMNCDEAVLSRALGGVSKAQAMAIAERYRQKYDADLVHRISERTGGNYRNALVAWISNPDPSNGLEDQIDSGEHHLIPQSIAAVKESIANLDAELLKKAKGTVFTDERMLVSILCRRSKSQLNAIDLAFRAKFEGMSLKTFVEKSTGGNLEEFLVYVQMSEAEFDSYHLFKAFDGMGCDKPVVIEILTTRTFERIQAARDTYEGRTDSNLPDRIRDEMSGPLERLCVRLVTAPRGNMTGSFDADVIAQQIYDAGAGRVGTDEDAFVDIFTSHTLPQMKEVAAVYDSKFNSSLEAAVESEFSGKLCQALLGLLSDPVDTFCRRLKKAMDGVGTDERSMNRIIGGQDKMGAAAIVTRWKEKYKSDLAVEIAKEVSGDYCKALQTYLMASDPTNGVEFRKRQEANEAENAEAKTAEYAAAIAAANAAFDQAREAALANAEAEAAAIEATRLRDAERAALEQQRRDEQRAAELEAQRIRAERREAERLEAERQREEKNREMEAAYQRYLAEQGGKDSSSSSSSSSSSDSGSDDGGIDMGAIMAGMGDLDFGALGGGGGGDMDMRKLRKQQKKLARKANKRMRKIGRKMKKRR